MNKILLLLVGCSSVLLLSSCTEQSRARLGALGDNAHITCFSAGTVVFDGVSDGKISRLPNGAHGYRFIDKKTQKLKEVMADCVVSFGEDASLASSDNSENTGL